MENPLRRASPAGVRRLINIGHMLSGNFANAGIMLLAVAIAARGLGPKEFGSMVLVLALASFIERLVRFETWQPLIKFAAEEERNASPTRMARLYALGLVLDIGTAFLAAALTVSLSLLLSRGLGWESISPEAASIYAVAMLCNITGSPGAALRLAGRFGVVAYVQVPGNLLRVALAALCFWQDAGLLGYIIAWTISEVVYRLATVWLGFGTLVGAGIPKPWKVPVAGLLRDFPDFLPFAWSINLSTMLRTLTTDADELVVGAVAGTTAASMYNLAKRIAKFSQEVGNQIQTVIYPELARMWSSQDARLFRSTVVRMQWVLTGLGVLIILAVWLVGPLIIRIGLGSAYLPAYGLLSIQVIAVLFTLRAAPGRSAILSMGHHRLILAIAATGVVVFYCVMVPGVFLYGAKGASIAHVVLAFTNALLFDLLWRHRSQAEPILSR